MRHDHLLSAGQLEHVMDKEYEEMLGIIGDAIDHARDYDIPMTLTLMDAFRTDPDRLIEAFDRFSYPVHLGGVWDWPTQSVLGRRRTSNRCSKISRPAASTSHGLAFTSMRTSASGPQTP